MAIHRGIQSALFFYLSCAPCADARYRKRRKKEAAASELEAREIRLTTDTYTHPGAPSSTNQHWDSEIALGPTLVRRGRKKTNTGESQRALQPGRVSSNSSHNASTADLGQRSGSHRVNLHVNQRDDEALWGPSSVFDGSLYSGSIRRPPTARTAGSEPSMYHSNRNPAINEMHPPTVTKVSRREDVMWMMQPLPVAEVMSGKERPSRGRSDSGGSRLSPSSTNLSRQVSNRIVEHRLRGDTPTSTEMSRQSSFRSAVRLGGQRHDRNEHDFSANRSLEQSQTSLAPPRTEDGEGSAVTALRKPELAATRHGSHCAGSRPLLQTVMSESELSKQIAHRTPKEDSGPGSLYSAGSGDVSGGLVRRSTVAVTDNPMSSVFRHKHEDSEITIRPELFDSWYTPEFELPKWIAEHTKREVRERWSMDI
ncbi:hypothetical protein Slin14017_G013680 [Septoria linicola]|nr:hypothetical protein Slin14017_G013680 [Septoria linicola]